MRYNNIHLFPLQKGDMKICSPEKSHISRGQRPREIWLFRGWTNLHISVMQGKWMFYSTRPTFWWILVFSFYSTVYVYVVILVYSLCLCCHSLTLLLYCLCLCCHSFYPAIALSMYMFSFIDPVIVLSMFMLIKFVSDLRQVGGFLRVLRFPPPIKLTTTK